MKENQIFLSFFRAGVLSAKPKVRISERKPKEKREILLLFARLLVPLQPKCAKVQKHDSQSIILK
jgi:hypothetical protein